LATASPSVLPAITIGDTFSVTVNIIPGAVVPPAVPEVISSVTGSLTGSPSEPGITVVGGVNSVTISGKHVNTFTDKFKYLEPGQNDLTSTPIEAIGRGNVPPDKNLFNLNQDKRKSEIRTYNLIVNGSTSLSVTQEVLNPLEAMRLFMANYNYKAS